MTEKPPLPGTEALTATAPAPTERQLTKAARTQVHARRFLSLGHVLVGGWALVAALATVAQPKPVQWLERQLQTLFFELRGPVLPPDNIVILAMDDDTTVQGGQIYSSNPREYAYLEPLKTSPPQRAAYAIAIDRLMQAGAQVVSLDVVLDALSSHGEADDARLQQVLDKYAGKVVLAATLADADNQTNRTGNLAQPIFPNPIFQSRPQVLGLINFPLEPNGKIHQLPNKYPQMVASTYSPMEAQEFLKQLGPIPSFAEATLQASGLSYPASAGDDIFFYGPQGTFKQISFWQVFDPKSWNVFLQEGTFKNKIVLIGPTAQVYQDFQETPFSASAFYGGSKLTGIEVHANAIATLLTGKAIRAALPNPIIRSAAVLLLVLLAGYLQSRHKRGLYRFLLASGIALGWVAIGYIAFTQGRMILPVSMPVVAIVLSGVSYLATASMSESLRKLQLRQTLERYAGSPLVQEIISQQDDLQDLLQEREQAILGKKLAGRYKIVKLLGAGGFGETYIAEDNQRPGNPICVVKQLRPASNNPKLLRLARRLFEREADTLQKLGEHSQIPQLLAYFEEDEEFYLVQEFVDGHSLTSELLLGKQLPENQVVALLQDLLQILEFVHSRGVIHRDIKPSNIIRRRLDNRLVLIDFGAVKEIHQMAEEEQQTGFTVGIGTQGYMPNEQCAGSPRFNSDVYAVGMLGIQALTGVPPSQFKDDPLSGEILWRHRAKVSHTLAECLSQMIRYDHRSRYQSAVAALEALNQLASPPTNLLTDSVSSKSGFPSQPVISSGSSPVMPKFSDDVTAEAPGVFVTQPWPKTFGSEPILPSTEVAPGASTESLGLDEKSE